MAAAIDLHACLDAPLTLASGSPAVLIPAGFALHMARVDLAAIILPRSGAGQHRGLVLGNSAGLVDANHLGLGHHPSHPTSNLASLQASRHITSRVPGLMRVDHGLPYPAVTGAMPRKRRGRICSRSRDILKRLASSGDAAGYLLARGGRGSLLSPS